MSVSSIWRAKGVRPQAVVALLRRDFRISRSYPFAFLSDIFFGALNLGVFYFISKTFSGGPTMALQGAHSYFAFVAVGVALTTVIQGASSGLARQVREEQLTGTLEALVAQPTTAAELSLGLAGFPFLFGMARAVLYMGLAAPFLHVDASTVSWAGLVVMFLVTAGAVTSIGVALGALVLVFKRSEGLVALVS
ncbi:MAG: type transport system permease protein, partial [Solirubrobacteraceae bacterium]|nr:type transport system permease protein [Solirubrobacteraceae bacterium]